MTGDQISPQGQAGEEAGHETSLRRRLLFQSRHRGVKELDLILGRFAEAHFIKPYKVILEQWSASYAA